MPRIRTVPKAVAEIQQNDPNTFITVAIMRRWIKQGLRSLWPVEHGISIEPIDGREDHTALAVYLIDNVHGLPSNSKVWSTSRDNLAKPIYTEPVEIVDSIADIKLIPTATQTAFERLDGEAGTPVSAYIRCVLPERPVIRGRQIILPKPPKRGGKKANEPI